MHGDIRCYPRRYRCREGEIAVTICFSQAPTTSSADNSAFYPPSCKPPEPGLFFIIAKLCPVLHTAHSLMLQSRVRSCWKQFQKREGTLASIDIVDTRDIGLPPPSAVTFYVELYMYPNVTIIAKVFLSMLPSEITKIHSTTVNRLEIVRFALDVRTGWCHLDNLHPHTQRKRRCVHDCLASHVRCTAHDLKRPVSRPAIAMLQTPRTCATDCSRFYYPACVCSGPSSIRSWASLQSMARIQAASPFSARRKSHKPSFNTMRFLLVSMGVLQILVIDKQLELVVNSFFLDLLGTYSCSVRRNVKSAPEGSGSRVRVWLDSSAWTPLSL